VDPRQREADGPVLVETGRCHGDAARGLRHAEAAAKGDAAALEEAKDRGLQEAGRRQPPAEAPARHLSHGCRFLLQPGNGAQPLLATIVKLPPSGGDADQSGGADLPQPGQERLQRGVPGEDVRSAPEKRAEQLQIPPERVVQRQIAKKNLPLAHEWKSCGSRVALREQVEGRKGESLLGPGAPRREEDRGRLVEAERGERTKRLIRLVCTQLPDLLAENGGGATLQAGGGVEEKGTNGRREPGRDGFHLRELVGGVHEDEIRVEPLNERRQLRNVKMWRERRDEDAMDEAGEVTAGRIEAVLGHDRDAGRSFADGGEGRGDPFEATLGLGVRPARGFGPRGCLKEYPVGVSGDALRKERRQGVSRRADRAESSLGPARARRRVAQGEQELAATGPVQIQVPHCGRDGAGGERPFGGGDDRKGSAGHGRSGVICG
jgi:hypothetical protein